MRASSMLMAALILLLSICGALVPGCGDDPIEPSGELGRRSDPIHPSKDELLDVNPNSPTYNRTVSPPQHLGQISAWYFGFAT